MTFSRPASALLLILVFMPLGKTNAQIFKIQGGASTMINADGGSVEVLAPNYEGSFGLGFFEHRLETGAVLRSKYRGYTLIAGDDSVRFDLPAHGSVR